MIDKVNAIGYIRFENVIIESVHKKENPFQYNFIKSPTCAVASNVQWKAMKYIKFFA